MKDGAVSCEIQVSSSHECNTKLKIEKYEPNTTIDTHDTHILRPGFHFCYRHFVHSHFKPLIYDAILSFLTLDTVYLITILYSNQDEVSHIFDTSAEK